MEVPRLHVISGPTHTLEGEVLALKEFWTLCILLMTDSETVVVETINPIFEYWSYTLFVDL